MAKPLQAEDGGEKMAKRKAADAAAETVKRRPIAAADIIEPADAFDAAMDDAWEEDYDAEDDGEGEIGIADIEDAGVAGVVEDAGPIVDGSAPDGGDAGPVAPRGQRRPPQGPLPPIAAKQPVLAWMRRPVEAGEDARRPLSAVRGLDPRLAAVLAASGVADLFPVQATVWREIAGGRRDTRDLCIAAPTGSGKTLAYALPVVGALAGRIVPRLRALVVLPTADLALQVASVMRPLCVAVGLTLAVAAGRGAIAAEVAAIRGPTNSAGAVGVDGGGADVLVATPGRLVAHLGETGAVTAAHLQYIVVDEADRLLRQSYQDWLPKLLAALPGGGEGVTTPVATPGGPPTRSRGPWSGGAPRPARAVMLIVSATLTHDPAKLARLHLHRPLMIAASAAVGAPRYALPPGLREYRLESDAEDKPLTVLALLRQLYAAGSAGRPGSEPPGGQTLIFAASVEATHRLSLLLKAAASAPGAAALPAAVAEYSSHIPAAVRAAALAAFTTGSVHVLVCSDAAARGLDCPHVATVISYDVPVYAKTYVHRVGRTARAGRSGRAITLLRPQEARHFKALLRKAARGGVEAEPGAVVATVRPWAIAPADVDAVRGAYDVATAALPAVLAAESRGGGGGLTSAGRAEAAAAGRSAALDVLRAQAMVNWGTKRR